MDVHKVASLRKHWGKIVYITDYHNQIHHCRLAGITTILRKGERKGGREGGREGGRAGGRKGGRKGVEDFRRGQS